MGVSLSYFSFAMDLTFDCEQLRKLPYRDFLATPYWREVAAKVKERDGFRCRVCNASKSLDVHHRTYKNHGQEHLHLDDLTTLCRVCHERHHFPPPEAAPKVIVKTVVKIKRVAAPQPSTYDYWSLLNADERKFYKRAAQRLNQKAKRLCRLGRVAVTELLEKSYAPKPQVFPQPQNPPRPRLNGSIIVGDIASVDADMPEGEEITLTEPIMAKCRANGSFTSATAKAFGLDPGKLFKGWPDTLIGKTMPRAKLYEAMRGRHLYSPLSLKHKRIPAPTPFR